MDQTIYLALDGEAWQELETDHPHHANVSEGVTSRGLDPEKVSITGRDLAFYKDTRLYRINSPEFDEDSLGLFFLSDGSKLLHLNGSSPPIHEKNAAEITLNEDTALPYLAFFCFFVRGEEGPFLVVDSMENDLLPESFREPDPERQNNEAAEAHRLYRPPALFGTDEDGGFRTSAMIFYSNAIFVADFVVQTTGMVEMLEDEPVMTDLSVRPRSKIETG